MRNKIRTSVSEVFVPKILSRAKYKLRAIVRKKLEVVEKLKTRGQFNAVVQKCHDPVEKIPIGVTVGLDSRFKKSGYVLKTKHWELLDYTELELLERLPFSTN